MHSRSRLPQGLGLESGWQLNKDGAEVMSAAEWREHDIRLSFQLRAFYLEPHRDNGSKIQLLKIESI
jgi:hypothetical protein